MSYFKQQSCHFSVDGYTGVEKMKKLYYLIIIVMLVILVKDVQAQWTQQYSTYPNSGYAFNSVFLINASQGWIAGTGTGGNYGVVWITTNGGNNWTQQYYTYPNSGYAFNSVFLINASQGWIAGTATGSGGNYGVVWNTTDGGNNWTHSETKKMVLLK